MQKVRSRYLLKNLSRAAYKTTISYFPSQYYSLSLNISYLALEEGSPLFKQILIHFTYSFNTYRLMGLCNTSQVDQRYIIICGDTFFTTLLELHKIQRQLVGFCFFKTKSFSPSFRQIA
jgi:hypothetical protein